MDAPSTASAGSTSGDAHGAGRAMAAWVRRALEGATPGLSPDQASEALGFEHAELAPLAGRHRVAAWLLATLPAGPAFAALRAALQHPALSAAARTMLHRAELLNLLDYFGAAGIECVVLKGPAIAPVYYPDAALRPYGDVDVMIHEADLDRASRRLAAEGFRLLHPVLPHRLHPAHGLPERVYVHPERSLVVELHPDHLQLGLEPRGLAEIWERAEERAFAGRTARVLEQHDLFIHLCTHLHRSAFERLIWFKDLDLVVRAGGLDWDVVAERAGEEGVRASVGYCLVLLERLLRTPLPLGARALQRDAGGLTGLLLRRFWPPQDLEDLAEVRRWRFRRALQFAPESGLLRGGLASFPFMGRRLDKARVLAAALRAAPRGGLERTLLESFEVEAGPGEGVTGPAGASAGRIGPEGDARSDENPTLPR